MSEVKVNKISPRTNCGTVQLGDSGDTITIPAGATITNSGTQTGFGRTGAVDWQTTVKTSTFTAVSGEGYFVDTNGGAVTANLPAGTAGAIVAFKDYRNTFDSNALTVAQNGSDKIGGSTVNATIATEGIGITLVFIDSTRGWLVTNDGLQSQASTAQYIAATGGNTVATCGNFKIHTFTSPGTFCVSSAGNAEGSNTVDYLVVAGAGGGGMGGSAASLPSPDKRDGGGGGGAGGYRESSGAASGCYTRSPLGACVAALPVAASPYPVTVGGGGAGAPSNCNPGTSGGNSIFAGTTTITSAGGGGGASKNAPGGAASDFTGVAGGSGGGASHRNSPTANSTTGGGAGNTPPVTPPQGNGGGNANNPWANARGGGGGGAQGGGQPGCNSGDGGAGFTSCITGSPVGYAGGGGAGGGPAGGPAPATMADGGEGGVMQAPGTDRVPNTFGAGDGAGGSETKTAGTDNRGSGGGGANPDSSGGANGGSGIVVIRYKFQ